MEQLEAKGLASFVKKQAHIKPVLGICLGMQMLFDESNEIITCKGLSLVSGKVRRIETALKLPHIGWNSLDIKKPSPLLKNVPDGSYVYFVHSYCGCPKILSIS
jgi:glutamine amidotransferase